MKSIVILCLKSGAGPPLRSPRIAWLEGIVTWGRQQHNGEISRRILLSRADSRFAPSQWVTALQSNAVSHWLGANLESALIICFRTARSASLVLMGRITLEACRHASPIPTVKPHSSVWYWNLAMPWGTMCVATVSPSKCPHPFT